MSPRYTLRWLVAAMTASAVLFFLLSLAVRYDRNWLVGVVAFFVALLALSAVHAALFLAVWVYTETTGPRRPPSLRDDS